MFLGDVIYRYRMEHGRMSMKEFAKRSNLSVAYINQLENNRNPKTNEPIVPSVETFLKVATAMGISLDELMEEVDENQPVGLDAARDIAESKIYPDPDLSGLTNISYPAARGIPILGTICAGNGVWCEENYDGEFFIDRSVKADLCLKIKGDSMVDAGINDGDYVFIRKVYDFEGGKIYAVRINGDSEAVIKVLHKKGDSIVLSSRNVEYEPLIEPAGNVSVIGECVGVYHAI